MEPSGELNIRKYLLLIIKKRDLFVLTTISIITAVVIVSYLIPKKYEAKSIVSIERTFVNQIMKDIALTPDIEERVKAIVVTMLSRNLLLRVMNDLKLVSDINQDKVEKHIGHFQKATEIRVDVNKLNKRNTDFFTVSFIDRDPELARDYVNTLVGRYIEENISVSREEAVGAKQFIAEQIKLFKDKIDKAEEEIIDFRKEKGIYVSMDEQKVVEEMKSAQEKIEELRIQRMELEAKKNLIKKQIAEEKPYTVTMFGRGTGDSLNDRLLMLQKRLSELSLQYTEKYPEVIKVESEIELIRKLIQARKKEGQDETLDPKKADQEQTQGTDSEISALNPLYQQLKEEASKTDIAIAALVAKEEHLKRLIESKKGYLREIPAEKKKLIDFERERDTYKKIYEDLVAKHGKSEVSTQMENQDKVSTFRIIDPAVLPKKPVTPNRVKIILMGILAGIGGGFGIVMLLDQMDKSVKHFTALKQFGVPVLAVIPAIRDAREIARRKRRDIFLAVFTGMYGLCIMAVFARELIG